MGGPFKFLAYFIVILAVFGASKPEEGAFFMLVAIFFQLESNDSSVVDSLKVISDKIRKIEKKMTERGNNRS